MHMLTVIGVVSSTNLCDDVHYWAVTINMLTTKKVMY